LVINPSKRRPNPDGPKVAKFLGGEVPSGMNVVTTAPLSPKLFP